MILTNSGVLKLMQRIKSFIASQLNTKANSVHTHTISEIDDLSSLQMGGGGYTKSEVDTLLNDYIPKSGGGYSVERNINILTIINTLNYTVLPIVHKGVHLVYTV